jgi:hypothetical protein
MSEDKGGYKREKWRNKRQKERGNNKLKMKVQRK